MSNYIQAFEERLLTLFQRKAAEFTRYAEDEPRTALITTQLAGLYQDLIESLNH
jgi:hypothetical protein